MFVLYETYLGAFPDRKFLIQLKTIPKSYVFRILDFEALLDYLLLINVNLKEYLDQNMHLGILVLAIHCN